MSLSSVARTFTQVSLTFISSGKAHLLVQGPACVPACGLAAVHHDRPEPPPPSVRGGSVPRLLHTFRQCSAGITVRISSEWALFKMCPCFWRSFWFVLPLPRHLNLTHLKKWKMDFCCIFVCVPVKQALDTEPTPIDRSWPRPVCSSWTGCHSPLVISGVKWVD